jgi:hypothetical protein
MRLFAGHSILATSAGGNLFHLRRSGGIDVYTLIASRAEFKHERSWL